MGLWLGRGDGEDEEGKMKQFSYFQLRFYPHRIPIHNDMMLICFLALSGDEHGEMEERILAGSDINNMLVTNDVRSLHLKTTQSSRRALISLVIQK